MPTPDREGRGRELVALMLAIGLVTALNLVTAAALYNAVIQDGATAFVGLSENATQLLTTAFGGIVGVLGSYLGFRAGREAGERTAAVAEAADIRTETAVEAAGYRAAEAVRQEINGS